MTAPPTGAVDPGDVRHLAGVAGIDGRCAASATRRGDPWHATASPASRWLLVEHPGPWAPRAFDTSPETTALAERAVVAGLRAVLIRRPERADRTSHGRDRRWAYVDSRPGREAVRWGRYADDAELPGLPLVLDATVPSADPVYLVCTHGRHDACCAIWGRPVAAALAAARPEATWECSHIGGDRFAANVVALPHGLYYGRLAPATVVDVVTAYEAGRVVPSLLRGRSSLSAPEQAAQHHARLALAEDAVDALTPVASEPVSELVWRVRLVGAAGEVSAVVRAVWAPPELLTCSARRPEPVRTFELVSLDVG